MPSSRTTPLPSTVADIDVVRTVPALRERVAALRAGGRGVTVVPTMGAFHQGHLDLMREAGRDGHAVVVTLFVNPAQFAPGEDLDSYPRDEERDLARAAGQGVSLVFAPTAAEMYPEGFGTSITVAGPSAGFEGAARPDHFAGVATVVTKLLIAVRPDRAVFGQKDAQQVAVVRRLMADLHLDDVELVVAPTTREADGLAMSSRNAYLGPDDRAAAPVLHRALVAARDTAADGERDADRLAALVRAIVSGEPRCSLEYAAVVHPDTFLPLTRLGGDGALLVVAARVGPTRLLDNIPLPTPPPEA